MRTTEPIWEALRRLEHADIPGDDRKALGHALAALHGAEAIPLNEDQIERIRALDAQLSNTSR